MSLKGTGPGAESCPVCESVSFKLVYPRACDANSGDCFRVVQCTACNLAYTAPRPSSLDRYYPPRYRAYGRVVIAVLRWLYSLRVSRWMRLKPQGGSVLEIGCGPGLMLGVFHRRGWRVLGIERNQEAATIARRAPGLEITSSPIESLPESARFDLIIMFHVLEHIGDPVKLLCECAKRLAPSGHLITNVPNFASWQSSFAAASWLHLDVPRHLVHFTPETLAATLESAGLQLTNLSFASLEHDPYGWIESAISRLTGHPNTLTRFLMRMDPVGPRVILAAAVAVALLIPALLLAVTSWPVGKGALMEAISILSRTPENSSSPSEAA